MSLAANTKINTMTEHSKLTDKSLFRSQAYVDGSWVDSASNKTFKVTDPGTCETLGHVSDMNASDVQSAIDAAHRAFAVWKQTTARERARVLRGWADLMIKNQEDLARVLTLESGKPIMEARGEILYAASFIEWFGEEAKRVYGDVVPSPMPGSRIMAMKQPVGVAGIITPYNFPAAMITRKVGAAIAAGCTVVVRPAHETPYSALALCELAHRAGIPRGVLNVVPSSAENTPSVGLELTTNPRIRKVSFTGSTPIGKLLMQQSSSTMKRVSLELGGNAPFIVFDDADLEAAAEHLVACKFRNSGQTCVCANRVYVHENVYDEFVDKFIAKVEKLRVGHGLDKGTTFGPMITERGLLKVEDQLQRSVAAGAKIVMGGHRPSLHVRGHYFEPTVLTNVSDSVPMSCEETFGPLCPIYKFASEEEVLQRANNVDVGLAGYFFSRDIGRIFRVAEALEVGMVGVNTGSVSSEVSPFGGVKESGVGREGSKYGIDEYMNVKAINISL
ncbi:hypothetical protein GGH12_003534 [Coemansia sp. RSA 1822]|nr:hypothetical protein LPJ76_005929 [Coemansia sp. RSA 638]KAJ2541887.1 hypothetical protein GGF49_003304 [Coemansia sp. RSA 1853]KAJ2562013.1 hypothetical protein GGH12_003534 [Coemansia sp. RSA 1822]